mmetsp:Transcript_50825/g.146657  ORF Transcript_50825/g.146657 Transcript_50825/m.146657 type:complete len:157 (-) Transcript_50825:21-491(-)
MCAEKIMKSLLLVLTMCHGIDGLSTNNTPSRPSSATQINPSRRDFVQVSAMGISALLGLPDSSAAAADCFSDCNKNCLKIAPKDKDYCSMTCTDYCAQDDRTDGLSGSVSAAGGEVGILGGTFGQGTVPKGEDKPPSVNLPFLNFDSDQGRKLIGY